jgi:RimJ/RimL family protein N-acetyltransferase
VWSDTAWVIYGQDLSSFALTPRLSLTESNLDFDGLLRHGYFKANEFPEAMRARLASGARCHALLTNDRLANIGWTTRGYLELQAGVQIRDEASLAIFDCFTVYEFRSKGIYTDSLIRMLAYGRDSGALRALIGVDPDNLPSIRAIENAGFQPLYRLDFRRRFGIGFSRKRCT